MVLNWYLTVAYDIIFLCGPLRLGIVLILNRYYYGWIKKGSRGRAKIYPHNYLEKRKSGSRSISSA